jgi:hypothetical protein
MVLFVGGAADFVLLELVFFLVAGVLFYVVGEVLGEVGRLLESYSIVCLMHLTVSGDRDVI